MFLKDGKGKEKKKIQFRHILGFLSLYGQFFGLEDAGEDFIVNESWCPLLHAPVSEGSHSWICRVDFHVGKIHQTREVSVPFLVRLYYQA